MTILILHDKMEQDASVDSLDNLIQVQFVKRYLGVKHRVLSLEFGPDVEKTKTQLQAIKPDVVFNLVEECCGSGALSALAVQLLEYLGIPYTGCGPYSQMVSADKQLLKNVLLQHQIPTPGTAFVPHQKYIIKARMEHASVGLDDSCVQSFDDWESLHTAMTRKEHESGISRMYEQYIEGREFGCAFLGQEVLPVVEYVFDDQYQGHKIITYEAKWNEETVSYQHHQKRFDIAPDLCGRIEALGRRACACLMLDGYSRIDFRMDTQGNLYVIDINTNPCISPDSTFLSMIEQKQWTPEVMFQKIIDNAFL